VTVPELKTALSILACLLPLALVEASLVAVPGVKSVTAISEAGMAAGHSNSDAFRWDPAGGYTNLGHLPGDGMGRRSEATAISADGSVIVGHTVIWDAFSSFQRAFIWTPSGGLQALGDTSLRESSALGLSSNGQIAGGWVITNARTQHAVLWNAGVETRRLRAGTSAWGLSRNGLWLGGTDAMTPEVDAFIWSQNTGIQLIGSLGPGTDSVNAVTDDGKVAVGQGGNYLPFRWTPAGGMQSLVYPGDSGQAHGLNADGSVVVGALSNAGAFLWTEEAGMRRLQDVLTEDYSLNLSGWNLRGATDISADGQTIVGYGLHNGNYEGFIVTIPEPSTGLLIGLGVAVQIRRARRRPRRA
jgi:uncharacterized membrane protein